MHTVLNAEWDRVKWCPVSQQAPDCGLTDENGFFLPHPALFRETRPSVEAIMTEVRAQYDRLTELGFSIRYIDSHMFSEIYAVGMDAAMEAFAREKGLLDHMYYYNFPPIPVDYSRGPEAFRDVPGGQYLLISHPSLDSEEMRMTGNQKVSGRKVAADRARETAVFSNPDYTRAMQDAGIRTLRYDEAAFDQRLTPAQLDHMLHG